MLEQQLFRRTPHDRYSRTARQPDSSPPRTPGIADLTAKGACTCSSDSKAPISIRAAPAAAGCAGAFAVCGCGAVAACTAPHVGHQGRDLTVTAALRHSLWKGIRRLLCCQCQKAPLLSAQALGSMRTAAGLGSSSEPRGGIGGAGGGGTAALRLLARGVLRADSGTAPARSCTACQPISYTLRR